MERMVCNHLTWFLEIQNILVEEQAGFRKHQSTSQQVTLLSQEIKDCLDKKQTVLAVYVDFKGAYDSVPRLKLLEKMVNLG